MPRVKLNIRGLRAREEDEDPNLDDAAEGDLNKVFSGRTGRGAGAKSSVTSPEQAGRPGEVAFVHEVEFVRVCAAVHQHWLLLLIR